MDERRPVDSESCAVFIDEDVRGIEDLLSLEDSKFCEVPIVVVNGAHLLDVGHMYTVNKGKIMKKIGRPRKKMVDDTLVGKNETISISNSSLLDLGPDKIAERVWQIGLDLGVSGGDDDLFLMNKLGGLERRDRQAIGREDRL
ncbi:HIT domain-containing protein [Sesbania bispinosa]|nr:HIT domain-containing protein [Sesbania bispinosa]